MFGSNRYNDTNFILNGLPLSFSHNIKYLGIEFNNNLDFSNFFIDKFSSGSNSFYSLNSFGFKPGGVSPFLQSFIYKSFCISRLLYGFEILPVNKKTRNSMNLSQNNLIRYMTGLSKNSHISNTRKILRILSIDELYRYMKLIFVKNLRNSNICVNMFNQLLNSNYKKNTKSFIKTFRDICSEMNLDVNYVVEKIQEIINDYKDNCLIIEDNTETELITLCLNNNHDFSMINQLSLVTYAGPQCNLSLNIS